MKAFPFVSLTMARWRPVVSLVLVCLGLSLPAAAWCQTAVIRGRVVDSELGEALPGAIVRITPANLLLTADTLGRFEARGLPPGEVEVSAQAIGYEARTSKFTVLAGQVVDMAFPLDFNGEQLPEVVVTARATRLMPRFADFERRRTSGSGAFMRWDEIKQRNFSTIGDAARTIRGVRIICDQARFECFVRMSRSMNCNPIWFVDGVQVSSFHENTAIRDIYGLEVYRGPGEVPGEFTGSDAGCGVLAIWTKSKPYR